MAKIGRGSEQAMIRLPDGMRDKLKAAAAANGRSMNAEIVARLEEYETWGEFLERHEALNREFMRLELEKNAIQAENDLLRLDLRERRGELAELQTTSAAPPNPSADSTLYIVLDADGLPISWQEISTHLSEIARAGDLDITQIEARIFNAEQVSNSAREEEFFKVYQWYRNRRTATAN